MDSRIKDILKEADMVLVGIGEEFSPVFPSEPDPFSEYRKSRFYAELPEEHRCVRAYRYLAELIGEKPYFAVTMNTDDLAVRSGLSGEQVVAPCGSMQKMQCSEHIVDAADICKKVLEQQDEKEARCPVCGKPLHFHTIRTEGYLEEGYLGQWEKYTRWLQNTLNHRLCILELGVGFSYPQVVRFPFEKTAYYNKKATLIRVSSRFWQLPEELREKGISVQMNPIDFLLSD